MTDHERPDGGRPPPHAAAPFATGRAEELADEHLTAGAPGLVPQPSIARRVLVGTISNSASQAIVVLSTLALTPFIVRQVGAEAYGLWVLVNSLTSFIYLLDLGLSAALVKFVAEHAAQDTDEAARMVGAGTWLYSLLGVGAAVLGSALAFVLPGLFDLESETGGTAVALMVLAAATAGLSLPAVAPLAVLRGLQRFAAVNAITAGTTLLGAALVVGALLLDTGIVGVAAATLTGSAVTLVISFVVVRRIASEVTGNLLRRDLRRLRQLLGFSAPLAVMQVAGRIHTRVDAIIIAAALPVARIAPYSFAQQLGAGTRMAAEQFTRILLPMATELGRSRDAAFVRALLLTATRLTLAIAVAAGLPLALFGGEVLQLWVGPAFAPFGLLVALLAATALVDVTTYPAAAVLQSVELHRPLATMAIASGVVNVALSALLVGPLGLTGVALASLLATCGELALLFGPYVLRNLHLTLGEVARAVPGRLLGPVAAYAILLNGLATVFPVASFPGLVAVVVLGLVGYASCYVVVSASEYERAACRSAARLLTGARRGPRPGADPP